MSAGSLPTLANRYSVGMDYLLLRVAERFGMRPAEVNALPPDEQAVMLAFDHVRQQEEARAREPRAG